MNNNWISVNERLPELRGTYNCYGDAYEESYVVATDLGAGVYRKEYDEEVGNWYLLDSDPKYNCRLPEPVRYWQPLPEPPEPPEQDNER